MTKAEYSAQRRVDARARGFCIQCCKRPIIDGQVRCAECRDYHRKYHREYQRIAYVRAPSAGRVDGRTRAGRIAAAPVGTWCDECIAFGFHRDGCKEVQL